MSTFYDNTLRLLRDAIDEDIKKAYRDWQLKHHPDKTKYLPQYARDESETISKVVIVAYEHSRTRAPAESRIKHYRQSLNPTRLVQSVDLAHLPKPLSQFHRLDLEHLPSPASSLDDQPI
jgi:preprotein translocase subunit Sec63